MMSDCRASQLSSVSQPTLPQARMDRRGTNVEIPNVDMLKCITQNVHSARKAKMYTY